MNYSVVMLALFFAIFVAFTTAGEQPNEGKHGTWIRQKKRIVTQKKQYRNNERMRGRQASYHRSTIPSSDEFVVIATSSEKPNGNWKPIIYERFVEDPSAPPVTLHKNKPTRVNAETNGNVGHIQRASSKTTEPQPSAPAAPPQHEHSSSEPQLDEYALLHYYIPFDQLVTQTPKPIMESPQETPPKPISIEELMRAAVEPIPVFRLHTTSSAAIATGAAAATPMAPAKTEPPPTTTTWPTVSLDPKSQEKEDEFSGRYEYEYFVQDNHWGTNFGHKEFRDGKQTKGDYEVVLPDGRVQHVQYWSDATGYHASVTYHPLYKKFKQFKP